MIKHSEKSTFLALCLVACMHAAITFIYALTRLYSYKASLLDIGLFDQLFWNMLHHGTPLTTATLPFTPQHWLGFHFSPLLLALLPFYAAFPCPETLQLIQSICFAVAGIPLFFAVRALGARPAESWGCALLYWLNPLILSAALWDFHEVALSTPLIAFALWALAAKRFNTMLIALGLLLLTKEHYGISAAGFGFLWGWRYKDWKRGGAVMLAGLACAFIIITLIMPHFHGGTHAMLTGEGTVVSRYSWLFGPWHEKLATFITIMFGDGSPQITGFLHLLLLLLSGLMLPLLVPFYLAPAGADLLANLLSTNPMPRHIASYHGAACIPVFIFAGLQGYKWLEAKRPGSRTLIATTAMAMVIVFPLSGLTTYPVSIWELSPITLTHDRKAISDIKTIIGTEPVAVQANIGMFFSQREFIYPYPAMANKSSFVLLHLAQPFSDPEIPHFNIPYSMSTQSYCEALLHFMAEENWHIAYWHKPWLVMKRGTAMTDETKERADIQQAILDMGATARPDPQNP